MTCPHSTQPSSRPQACSQCRGIAVERIVSVDSVDEITAVPKTKPKVHWRERAKQQAAARARQARERAARALWQRNSTLITAPRSP